MSKYKKLEEYFWGLEGTHVRLTYEKINEIIEGQLPPSSYKYPVWWANGGHYYSDSWLNSGWRVEDINLGNWVDFVKVSETSKRDVTYKKLVRDGIPGIIESSGRKCETKIVHGGEKQELLEQKLQEEVAEYLQDKNLEELADVMEVLFGLADSLGYSEEELLRKRDEKREERGGFKEGIVLLRV